VSLVEGGRRGTITPRGRPRTSAGRGTFAHDGYAAQNGFVTPPLIGVSVLVVEDDVDLRTLLRIWLEAAGAQVQDAADGIEALEAVRRERPDVIVCDLQMPGLDGCGFLDVVRNHLQLQIPAIALTGVMGQDAHVKTFETGFHRHLRKPITRDVIVDQVIQTLGGRRGQ
jgi:two-component system, chemotaxis family, CheB/CheR fusion protein